MDDKLHWSNLQVDRTQANFYLPDFFQNAAHVARKGKMARKRGKAEGRGNGEEADEAQGEQQLPNIVDRPGTDEPLPLGKEKNDEE